MIWSPWCPGDFKSLLQHNSSKVSVIQCSAFFTVLLSHPYMTTGKTIALNIWIFVGKIMSLLFNMLSRLVSALLPRSKYLLISWLQLPSTVIFEPKKIKPVTVCIVFPIYLPLSDGNTDAMILVFWMLCFKPAFSFSIFTFIKRFYYLHFFSFLYSPGNFDSNNMLVQNWERSM